jgi:hypothetical protein
MDVVVSLLHSIIEWIVGSLAFAPFVAGVTFPKGNEAQLYVFDPTNWDGTTEADLLTMDLIPLDGLETYDRESRANKTDYFFYMRTQAVSTIGIPARGITLAGQYAQDDAGQDMLRAYGPDGANANDDLGFVYLRDGSNGFAQLVQVGGTPESSRAEGGLQPVSFELAPQSEPVALTAFTGS